MLLRVVVAVLVLLLSAIVWYVLDLIKKRKQIAGLPQPPMLNSLVGHLHIADECSRLFPEDVHPHAWADYVRKKYDLPEVFYLDWRPFGALFVYIADPELAAQYVTTAQSLPKSILETQYLDRFLGSNNLISIDGPHWKQLRSMFNPGFSASNVMTMVNYIVDASVIFQQALIEKARTNENFELEEYAMRLTVDIIGRVSMDIDMNSQKTPHPLTVLFRDRVLMMPNPSAIFPWQDVNLLRPIKMWWNGRQLDSTISKIIDDKIFQRAKEMQQCSVRYKKTSVLDLALGTYEKEMSMSDIKGQNVTITNPSQLPRVLRQDLIDSVKAFFFAGHDTSSSTISYVMYVLHRYPAVRTKLVAELDTHFPPGKDAATIIKADPYIINKLEYLLAVIKETLRIFPPASTVRVADINNPPKLSSITDPRTGAKYSMLFPQNAIYPVAHMIHRNERFFPEPTKFIPERFISSQTPFPDAELFTPAGKEAHRPFEKGPRNCIGQELALVETKIALVLIVREFDFVLEFPGEKPDLQYDIPISTVEEFSENAQYGKDIRAGAVRDHVEGHRLYQILKGSAKPAGGCPGRIYLTK